MRSHRPLHFRTKTAKIQLPFGLKRTHPGVETAIWNQDPQFPTAVWSRYAAPPNLTENSNLKAQKVPLQNCP